jgi:hypothetical protein
MECIRITYELLTRPGRKEYSIEFKPGHASARDMVAALMRHEFPEIAYPFGPDGSLPAEDVLKRYGIVNVTHSLMRQNSNESL